MLHLWDTNHDHSEPEQAPVVAVEVVTPEGEHVVFDGTSTDDIEARVHDFQVWAA